MGWVPPDLPKDHTLIMLHFDELREMYVAGERRQKEGAMQAILRIGALVALALCVLGVKARAQGYVPPKAPPVDEVQNARLDAHEVAMARILDRLESLESRLAMGTPHPNPPPQVGRGQLKAPPVVMETRSAPQSLRVAANRIPPGHHAHQTITGEVIVHSDANLGNAAAHHGIARPWVRIAEAGEIVGSGQWAVDSDCPVGDCPVVSRGWAAPVYRAGPLKKIGRALSGK
jgi:hypothetical protein